MTTITLDRTGASVQLASLTLDELGDAYDSAGPELAAEIVAECKRRDDADKRRRARRAEPSRAAWYEQAHSQWLAAERDCRGVLLNAAGIAAGIDPFSLWSNALWLSERFMPEELRLWFQDHPRVTFTEYARQERRAEEVYRDELDRDDSAGVQFGAGAEQACARDSADCAGDTVPEVAARAETGDRASTGPAGHAADVRPGRRPAVTSYSDIEPLPTEWLWTDRIPRGEVTLLAGEGGVSKGLCTIDLAARVSRGAQMPLSGAGTGPANVLLITPEDDLAETVAWRLRAAGADLGRIHDLTMLSSGAPFVLSAAEHQEGSIAQLRAAVDMLAARLVIIDPLMATIGYGTVTTNLGARRVMAPLQRLAKETGAAVVLTHHLVKSGAIAGSKALTDAARVVYLVRKDRENPAIRVMSLEKSNVLGATEDLRYTLTGEGHGTRLQWLGRDELAARRTAWRTTPAPDPAAVDAARARLTAVVNRGA